MPVVACNLCGRVTHKIEKLGEPCGSELRTPLGFNDDPPICKGTLVNPKPKNRRRTRKKS